MNRLTDYKRYRIKKAEDRRSCKRFLAFLLDKKFFMRTYFLPCASNQCKRKKQTRVVIRLDKRRRQIMTKDVFIKEVRDAEAMLYHISKSILKNDSDCGDAVQETILKAYEKLPTLKKEKYFRTWITRILINECKGILRKRKNVIPYEEYMDNMRLTEEDSYSHLYMAIMELPEDLRILVTLYYLEGFSQKEISEALDIPEGTIKSRLSRAREFLKVQLSEEEKKPATGKNSKRSKRITGKGKMLC